MFAGFLFISKFQSTLPRRERRTDFGIGDTVPDFNPRSREGSDCYQTLKLRRQLTFQSTLPRRERHKIEQLKADFEQFQSTLPRRERLFLFPAVLCSNDFNPRSREGSDLIARSISDTDKPFQSTLPRRERRKRLKCICTH